MNSTVVKTVSKKISRFFRKFGEYVRSDKVRALTRKHPHDFIRIFKFPWFDVLYYLIFRSENCTQAEITKYYSDIGQSDLRISKQAAFKAIRKVNPLVFPDLIHTFASYFYQSDLVKTYKGYILLAEDGTTHELLPSKKAFDRFGFVVNQFVHSEQDAQKATSRSAALYDLTNGLIVDFTMNPYKKSEIPIAIEHLTKCHSLLNKQNVIYLADRNYDSVELFAILEDYGFHYCIRGKCNFFKKYVSQMKSNDEWIEVMLDKAWLNRLKYDQSKARFANHPTIRIRVVKTLYHYMDKHGKLKYSELIYFTNLDQEEFSAQEITKLYVKRWDIECTYKTLKTDYEWERFFSEDCDCEMCSIYAKVLFHNITGIIRKEMNSILSDDAGNHTNKYTYVTNIVQLSHILRENHMCRWIRSQNVEAIERTVNLILKLLHKLKVPVRPDRHNQRWGRIVTRSNSTRFRLDGRNWPKVAHTNGHLQTVQP